MPTRSVTAVAACLVLAACGGTSSRPSAIEPGAAACSRTPLGTLPPPQWAPARRELAPRGADEIRLCRYSGLTERPRLALVGAQVLGRPEHVNEVLSELDRLPDGLNRIRCPPGDGSEIVARIAYPTGRALTVTISLTGCEEVTNGSVARTALGTGLIGQLERLLATGSRAGAGSAVALAHARWSVVRASPDGPSFTGMLLWDGHDLLELFAGPCGCDTTAFSPALRRWRRLASPPPSVQPGQSASVWTGQRVFVLGGSTALYDPATNRWTLTRRSPLGPVIVPTVVWTGQRVVVAAQANTHRTNFEFASYDPATNAWTTLRPPIRSDRPTDGTLLVATRDGVLLWLPWEGIHGTGVDVFRLGPAGGWTDVTGAWTQHVNAFSQQPILAGAGILFAPEQFRCEICGNPRVVDIPGFIADPRTLSRTAIPAGPFRDREPPQVLWTGSAEIQLTSDGVAVWDPRTGLWSRGPPAPRPLSGYVAPVWAAGRLYSYSANGALLAYGR